jgi:L-alanine-DL-glutamate epimerase-like enolase superfamily enzyme
MQITRVEVVPVELELRLPYRSAQHPEITHVTAVFVRVDTQQGLCAWGCTAYDPVVSEESLADFVRGCRACADRVPDLNPLNTEYALEQLARVDGATPAVLCAFDLAFYDLLGLATGLPLHRLMGGYRYRIQTAATVGLVPLDECVELACERARQGFRIIKIKGGLDAEEDVERVRAIHEALPALVLRLDADQGYTVEQALDVARALKDELEALEQPTLAADVAALCQVTRHSPIPILADESVAGPDSALAIAAQRAANAMSVKLVACGGLRCARQIDTLARAAKLATTVSCVHEPALLTAAGLAFALGSSNIRYGDLDGHLDLIGDPTVPGFVLEEGWLIASDMPGLGCAVEL